MSDGSAAKLVHKNDVVGIFAQHKVAANLLMLVMLLSGFWALGSLNTQFFPTFDMEIVTVRVVWPGATAEDVERSVIVPLEQELRTVDGLDEMTSTSGEGVALITLEFPEGTDMGIATARVDDKVSAVRNLPVDAETPVISHAVRYEAIANLLVYGPDSLRELRPLVRRFERELLDAGIARVAITGLPEEEVAIQLPHAVLEDLGLSLKQVADRVGESSRDQPAGTVGRNDVGRQLRSLQQQRSETGFEQIPLVADDEGRLLRLGDVANVDRRERPNQVSITYKGHPAVELKVERSEKGDSLESAELMQQWIERTRQQLPPNVHIEIYDESWQLIRDRMMLLVKNGAGGLVLVVLILYLFLNSRVAGWVMVGIPVSFMATLAIIYLAGGSINMISLFALIMALGIIVDDAIVVGEDALTHHQTGESSLQAAEGGARRMLAPVLSSSLTTIAAFIPLFSISGLIGKILIDIPFVVVCVILASLIESFLVLPGHLRHSFLKMRHSPPGSRRQRLDDAFIRFRDKGFRPFVTRAVEYRWTTVAIALASVIFVAGLAKGGRLGFTFFPTIEGNLVVASATFVAGTPPDRAGAFIREVEQALYDTNTAFGGGLLRVASVANGKAFFTNAQQGRDGEQYASVTAELIASDQRTVRNEEFLAAWESRLKRPAGLESLTLTSRRGGHPGRDLEIRLTGTTPERLKAAATSLGDVLASIPGVSGIEDDMPYGRQQLIFELTPQGQAAGLTVAEVGRQLRAALDGYLAQVFNEGEEEVEVRVMLPDSERHHLTLLDDLNLRLPNGQGMPLSSALRFKEQRGFEILRHADGQLALTLYADVDHNRNNANRVREQLRETVLPDIVHNYGVNWSYAGKAKEQQETLDDMKRGGLFALAMIYIVLAWVFGSYGWPLVVMSVIPFGIVGAILGHWVMGIEPTILSLFGFFGLAGIVVNDSIILVIFYKQQKEKGMATREAVVEAACQRLRAVLLTSLTTIAGLTPLLFETSLQAQFLIPMAVSISFGLAFATFLVLVLVPSLLTVHESVVEWFRPVPKLADLPDE